MIRLLQPSADLYVVLHIPNTPNAYKRTKTVAGANPIWNEMFNFLVNPNDDNNLDICIMDANLLRHDTKVGEVKINLNDIPLGHEVEKELVFPKGITVNIRLLRIEEASSDLRFSLALSEEEKEFLSKRRPRVYDAMRRLLGVDGPRTLAEVATIGVLGSGGGFRATVGFSAAMKALDQSGVLDCVTYVASLSGGSWYASFLYSQPEFPDKRPADYQDKLRHVVCRNNWLKLLTPTRMISYIAPVLHKSKAGQPVSFTDFYGHLVGDIILEELKDCSRLSAQAAKCDQGQVPLPLYTCIHVKRDVSARVFQDWIEFTPYEIGFAKYATFMSTSHFGCKFYLGRLLRRFDEQPLHFLQGVWGSAFCILFKRLVKQSSCEDTEAELENYSPKDDGTDNDSNSSEDEVEFQVTSPPVDVEPVSSPPNQVTVLSMQPQATTSVSSGPQLIKANCGRQIGSRDTLTSITWKKGLKESTRSSCRKSFWEKTLENLFKSDMMNTRAGRAGLIFNPLRGLRLTETFPLSPFSATTADDVTDFKGTREPVEVQAKRLYLVDSGLTFNLPFPLLLRPQRAVEIYLSFDFGARGEDTDPPFKEILIVEKWAKVNKVVFPPIEAQVIEFLKKPLRQCYIFENVEDPYCPVILHFILLNSNFKRFKSPGVERETQQEKDFANFDVFSDPKEPYSVFNFAYTQLQFDRLHSLVEYNTTESLPLIKEVLARAVRRKRNLPPNPPIALENISSVLLKSKPGSLVMLQDYVKSMTKLPEGLRDSESQEEAVIKEIFYSEESLATS